MPLGKYYCDKQFQDTPPSRRRHLHGVAHQRAKALWYDAFRSSSQLGVDQVDDFQSIGKGVCNRFVRTVMIDGKRIFSSPVRARLKMGLNIQLDFAQLWNMPVMKIHGEKLGFSPTEELEEGFLPFYTGTRTFSIMYLVYGVELPEAADAQFVPICGVIKR